MEILKVKLSEDEANELIKKITEAVVVDDRVESREGFKCEFQFKEMTVDFKIGFYTEWSEVELQDLSIPIWRSVNFSWIMINEEGSEVEVVSDVDIDEGVIKEFEI